MFISLIVCTNMFVLQTEEIELFEVKDTLEKCIIILFTVIFL